MSHINTSDGARIYYTDTGAGPPLVFIHGWSMSGRVWLFQQELSDRFRVISLDLRGHGHSTVPGNCYSMADFGRDVAAVITALDLNDVTLVGWSMGAQVALQACRDLGGRLASLILVGGTPLFAATDDYPHGLPAVETRGMALRLKRDYQKTMGEFFRRMFVEGELEHDQYQRIVQGIIMGGKMPDGETAQASLEALVTADLRQVLPEVDVPVLLLHGGGDTICLPAASRYMAERLPKATLRILDGLGHAPFMSRPAEFNGIIREFADNVYVRN